MPNFIEELYYGNIDPLVMGKNEKLSIDKWGVIDSFEEIIVPVLDENKLKYFREYEKAWNDLLGASSIDSFVTGFRLGAKFTYDTFAENH